MRTWTRENAMTRKRTNLMAGVGGGEEQLIFGGWKGSPVPTGPNSF